MDELISVKEFALKNYRTASTIRYHIGEGHLIAYKISGKWWVLENQEIPIVGG